MKLPLPSIAWFVLAFAKAAAADYTVLLSGGSLSITDTAGQGDTLTLSEFLPGQIRFAVAGRTFSLNGGPDTTGNSGDFPLSSLTAISVNAAGGNDTINVSGFPPDFPSFYIDGGPGNDAVHLDGNLTLAVNHSLRAELQAGADTWNMAANSGVRAYGTGTVTVKCTGGISLNSGAVLETQDGQLWVEQAVSSAGSLAGIRMDGATMQCTGAGTLRVRGTGGATGGSLWGVALLNGSKIIGGTTGVGEVYGYGGPGTGTDNTGVYVSGTGGLISSGGSAVLVTGRAGANGSGRGSGIAITGGGEIKGSVNGTGAGAAGSAGNHGVQISGPNSRITSAGSLTVTGVPGPGSSSGLFMDNSAAIRTPGGITLKVDSIMLGNTASITTAGTSGYVEISPFSATVAVDLGGPDVPGPSGRLGLADDELDRIFTSRLNILSSPTSELIMSAPVSLLAGPGVSYSLSGNPIRPLAAGTDISVGINNLYLYGRLTYNITGPARDSQYHPLTVAGGVSPGATLEIISTYAGVAGDTFTLVDNDGSDPVLDFFTDASNSSIPEGAFMAWPGSPALVAQISYTGGDGNDVVLTLIAAGPAASIVTNTADNGSGSLRNAFHFAAIHAGPDTITFAPALAGQTITLLSDIRIVDAASVAIDASEVPGGIHIAGGGTCRLFSASGGSISFRGLTLTGGRGVGQGAPPGEGGGGAVRVGGGQGTLTITECTLSGNSAFSGGAVEVDGTLTMVRCTLSGNTATGVGSGVRGGAINLLGMGELTQCTLAGNSSTGEGGAIYQSNGTLTLTHCTLGGNTYGGSYGSAAIYNAAAATLTMRGCIVSGNLVFGVFRGIASFGLFYDNGNNIIQWSNTGFGIRSGPDALLGPLGDYGGPTQTMPLLTGSPARNAATGSTITTDQRGFPVVGIPDIGAYETGTTTNYNAWIWEKLPAAASAAEHDAAADFDQDGLTNSQEWQALSDPLIPDTFPILSTVRSGGSLIITFPTVASRTYTLWRSDNLTGAWTNTGLPAVIGSGQNKTFTISAPTFGVSKRFFRVQAAP